MFRLNKKDRLVINLTNACNEYCPFCITDAGGRRSHYMQEDEFYNIINDENIALGSEIQLTGGEPTLHPHLLTFIKDIIKSNKFSKIILDTNSILLDSVIEDIYSAANGGRTVLWLKISINYYLVDKYRNHLDRIRKYIKTYPNTEYFQIVFSIAHRLPKEMDNYFLKEVCSDEFKDIYKIIHPIEFIGRARRLKVPHTTISNQMRITSAHPISYASDGTCFKENFEKRNEHECKL